MNTIVNPATLAPSSSSLLQSVFQSVFWREFWGRIRRHLEKWKARLAKVPKVRVDGFEVFIFWLMLLVSTFFCTPWFVGPVADFWRTVLPHWSWVIIIYTIAAVIGLGFLEEDYLMRRTGSFLCFLFLWWVGSWTVYQWPRLPFGPLFTVLGFIPIWLFTRIAQLKIECEHREDLLSAPSPASEQETIDTLYGPRQPAALEKEH